MTQSPAPLLPAVSTWVQHPEMLKTPPPPPALRDPQRGGSLWGESQGERLALGVPAGLWGGQECVYRCPFPPVASTLCSGCCKVHVNVRLSKNAHMCAGTRHVRVMCVPTSACVGGGLRVPVDTCSRGHVSHTGVLAGVCVCTRDLCVYTHVYI